ncbi:hypothetical protein SUGI_0541110 [Cryptomeria japonica]|nr:hypothetical protein SUGI_0541110 [Cryptomeria japonica]
MEKINVLKLMGVLLVWLLVLKPCVGSSFTAWEGPGCSNEGIRYSNCGCYNLMPEYHGGYQFDFDGVYALFFNANDCDGHPHTTLGVNTIDCNEFAWNSFILVC